MNPITEKFLTVFDKYMSAKTTIDEYDTIGKSVLADKVESRIVNNEPIEFTMLGLPFKSKNIRDKVISVLPDLGERLMMENIKEFNREIKEFYKPGIRVTILSDGFCFNDVLGVSNYIVDAYKEANLSLIKEDNPVQIYDLRDFYSNKYSLSNLRCKIVKQFGVTKEKLEQEILMNPDTNLLYRQMMRFMEEEFAILNFPSRNQLHKHAKMITGEMMLRNEAYNNLAKNEFSNYIRLSMHKSVNNGAKFGFQLIAGPKDRMWHSPWHAAVYVQGDNDYVTIHRKDAEEKGLKLMYQDALPYFYSNN